MDENELQYDLHTETNDQQDARPKIDLEQLAKFEQVLLEKIEQKGVMKKLEDQANIEMSGMANPASIEQIFLMMAAGLMVLSLPFEHYLLAILLTAFTILIALVAGLTSHGKPFSASINLFTSLLGLLFFEFSAIYIHTSSGADASFWLYQILGFIFLFCTFFSASTYRKVVLEK